MKRKSVLFVVLALLAPLMLVAQHVWKPYEYNVSFKIKNAGITVNGKFKGFKSNLVFGADKLSSSSLSASVEVATINTGINKRDKDLQAEKYFNADKYPLIEVKSVKLYAKDGKFAGQFDVKIKGVTKQVEIPFSFTRTGNEAEFSGSFPLNRRDFGVGGNNVIMSDNLTVNILVKARE